ncbi:MAG TPA: 50S ribosomal protein L11 methyltransferase [Stellaceae bacterium]|nr:50S ribosomal protein L11 methyltransferase [Stellaceae bacterium]
MWRLIVDLADATALDHVVAAVGEQCEAISAFENGKAWRVEGMSQDKPDAALLDAALLLLGISPAVVVERLQPRDWVSENQAGFPPLRAGRFFIHGSHYQVAAPRDAIPILIDAATAFGTGEHATTRGCLLATALVKSRPRRILDMGCGTGILAIAATKLWRRDVLATDIDPESVRVTRVNAEVNGVAKAIRIEISPGYRHLEIARRAPFDLVFANILARPLMRMAPDLARVLAPGGVAILSGLLARQEAAVLSAHRTQGLHFVARIALEGWHTLVVGNRGTA